MILFVESLKAEFPFVQYNESPNFNKWLDANRNINDMVPELIPLSKNYFELFRNDYLSELSDWNFAEKDDREETIISNPENNLNQGFPTELYDRENNDSDDENNE